VVVAEPRVGCIFHLFELFSVIIVIMDEASKVARTLKHGAVTWVA
jgi:hypothetical protein